MQPITTYLPPLHEVNGFPQDNIDAHKKVCNSHQISYCGVQPMLFGILQLSKKDMLLFSVDHDYVLHQLQLELTELQSLMNF